MGKGSKKRPLDAKAFGANYAKAKLGQRLGPGKWILLGGQWVRQDGLRAARRQIRRKADSKNFRSLCSGCHPDQVPEFNKLFGHMGVRYDSETGYATYKDRRSKLRVLHKRGLCDLDETRSR